MAVPEGYTEVGLIGLVNKGNYDPLTEYSKYNFVYYQGSTYLYINELPQSGVTPSDDGVTWQYMSRGMIMDNTPTQGSQNAVTSGGIYDSERALKTEIQNEQTAATTKATDTNNVLGQGTVTNATNVQALLDNVTDKDTNPTKDSVKTVTSGGVYSADNQIRENIANVEGATSAHPYTVGKQLIFNGLLCKATSAIAVGDTLAVGTNLALADNVVEQIYSLNQGLTNSLDNFAPSYSSSSTYAVDSLVTYNGKFYKCIFAVTSPEQFDINKWDDVTTSEVYARTDNSHYYRVLSYNNTKSVPADTTKTNSQFIDYALISLVNSLSNELLTNQIAVIKSIGYNATSFVLVSNNNITHSSTNFGDVEAIGISNDADFMYISRIAKYAAATAEICLSNIKHSDGTVSYLNLNDSSASPTNFVITYDIVDQI